MALGGGVVMDWRRRSGRALSYGWRSLMGLYVIRNEGWLYVLILHIEIV